MQNQVFPLFLSLYFCLSLWKTNQELLLPMSLENVVELKLCLEENKSLFLSIDLVLNSVLLSCVSLKQWYSMHLLHTKLQNFHYFAVVCQSCMAFYSHCYKCVFLIRGKPGNNHIKNGTIYIFLSRTNFFYIGWMFFFPQLKNLSVYDSEEISVI